MNGVQVAKLVDVPYRTLMAWAAAGLVTPKGCGTRGRDTSWSGKDIYELKQIGALRAAGCSMAKAKEARCYLVKLGENPFSRGKVLCVLGRTGKVEDIIKVLPEGEAFALLKSHRGQIVMLPLEEFPAETGEKIAD